MNICIIGRKTTYKQILDFLNNRFVKIWHFKEPFTALQTLRQSQDLWNLVIIDKQLKDTQSESLKCLIRRTSKIKNIMIFDKIENLQQKITSMHNAQKKVTARVEQLVYNPNKELLYKKGEPIKLSQKEWKLLSFLLSLKGKIVSKESILEAVWGYKFLYESRTLATHISQLRNKLGKDLIYIKTIPKQGYILNEIN